LIHKQESSMFVTTGNVGHIISPIGEAEERIPEGLPTLEAEPSAPLSL
jgi:hypothetical protein